MPQKEQNWLWRDLAALFDRLFISVGSVHQKQACRRSIIFRFNCYIGILVHRLICRLLANPSQGFFECGATVGLAILTVQAFDSAQSKHIWELASFYLRFPAPAGQNVLSSKPFLLEENTFPAYR